MLYCAKTNVVLALSTMKRKILNHFKKVDPTLYAATHDRDWFEEIVRIPEKEYFRNICRTIVGQQLSGKAAHSIWKRFESLFPQKKVSPKKILLYSDEELRDAGMAYAKVYALKDLAEKVTNKTVRLKKLSTLDDQGVYDELIQVRGIGPWTIEMFMMFSLGREDLFSYGDLGLIKGIQKIHNLKKKPTERQLNRITKKWSPYRTYAALILWHHVDQKK